MDDVTRTDTINEVTARAYVAAAGFRIGPVGRVGVELEYLVRDPVRPGERPSLARLRAAVGPLGDPLPGGGSVSVEPGGQLEISSAAGETLSHCLDATAADLALVRSALAEHGLSLHGAGLDTQRPPVLVNDQPRYTALATYHDRAGRKGREVMCNSASVQVCLDAGDESSGWRGYRQRWWLADAIGPVLLAAFANSPRRRAGRHWVSYRQALRFSTDATRTRAPRRTDDPRDDWTRYAMHARVALIAEPAPAPWLVPNGLRMRDWLRGQGPRPVTLEDLQRHLGTLVPPVRPRGYLELRMIDQQPGDGWVVPLAVTTALLDDPAAAEVAAAATEPLRSPLRRHRDWLVSAREGLGDPALRTAALECFQAALAALDRLGTAPTVREQVVEFIERYVSRGRCPADDTFIGAVPGRLARRRGQLWQAA